jgi:Ferritin-like domain
MNSIHVTCSRRKALQTIGLLGIAASAPGSIAAAEREKAASQVSDQDIFNFALNLESLETEYYLRGTTGKGMDDADGGKNPGPVTGGTLVPWQNQDLRQFMDEVAANELAHVR